MKNILKAFKFKVTKNNPLKNKENLYYFFGLR